MEIKIKMGDDRDFLDALFEIEKYTEKVKLSLIAGGRKYITYILPDEWYESLNKFDKIRIEAFRN